MNYSQHKRFLTAILYTHIPVKSVLRTDTRYMTGYPIKSKFVNTMILFYIFAKTLTFSILD